MIHSESVSPQNIPLEIFTPIAGRAEIFVDSGLSGDTEKDLEEV